MTLDLSPDGLRAALRTIARDAVEAGLITPETEDRLVDHPLTPEVELAVLSEMTKALAVDRVRRQRGDGEVEALARARLAADLVDAVSMAALLFEQEQDDGPSTLQGLPH